MSNPLRSRWRRGPTLLALVMLIALGAAAAWLALTARELDLPWRDVARAPWRAALLARGDNPAPVALRLPAAQPLSAMASLGRELFYDRTLSASGRLSCASCHDPAHGYNPPPGSAAVMFGGAQLRTPGLRPPPSLAYLYRQRPFSIGPDNEELEATLAAQLRGAVAPNARAAKLASDPAAAAANRVPQGGLFWDGRADSLQAQASGPLFNPAEMDAGSAQRVARILRDGALAPQFVQLFGPRIFDDADQVVGEALFAIARYQFEDPSFHAFDSKYDAWLQGKAKLTPQEMRGYLAFTDPRRGNCAACHIAAPTRDGLPPLFTDGQYEALGVPRNAAIAANRDPAFFDLGLCGPLRRDLSAQRRYCGMFLTPTLRNAARRPVYFHNGIYRDLRQVLEFYAWRDTRPQRIYPRDAHGRVLRFNDLPAADRGNVDRVDAPFGRASGAAPALDARARRDIVAFLRTLDDGWRAPPR